MTLKQYLLQSFTPAARFAKEIGCSRYQVYRYINRVCVPRPDVAKRIVKHTKNSVSLGDLMNVVRREK